MHTRTPTAAPSPFTRWWRRVAAAGLIAPGGIASCAREAPRGEAIAVSRIFGESGAQPGQFGYPRCMDASPAAGELWVIDKIARVQRIDARTGAWIEDWQTPKFDKGKPTGVTFWSPRTPTPTNPPVLFIADTHEHRIIACPVRERTPGVNTQPPAWTRVAGGFGDGPGRFIYPTDVAVLATPDGERIARLYVSEYGGNDRVSIFEPARDANGSDVFDFVRSFGAQGDSADPDTVRFNRPQSMALDAREQRLIITDACNHRVGVFTFEGALVRWLGARRSDGTGHEPSAEPGGFTYPYGVALLDDGTAMISEFGNNRLQRVDLASGACLGTFGNAGRGVGQLVTPWAVAALGEELFVLDSGNSRVQVMKKPKGRPRELASAGDLPARAIGGGR
jgi:DNA-binding beta-propeller fold protein YncE